MLLLGNKTSAMILGRNRQFLEIIPLFWRLGAGFSADQNNRSTWKSIFMISLDLTLFYSDEFSFCLSYIEQAVRASWADECILTIASVGQGHIFARKHSVLLNIWYFSFFIFKYLLIFIPHGWQIWKSHRIHEDSFTSYALGILRTWPCCIQEQFHSAGNYHLFISLGTELKS